MDVVIFTLQTDANLRRCAVETRFVDEVIPLGVVTPVPSAPPVVVGAMNVRGRVCPVLQLQLLLRPGSVRTPARPGHPCLLISAGDSRVVLCVGHIEEVARVTGGLITCGGGDLLVSAVLDGPRGALPIIDPEQAVLRAAREVRRLASAVLGERPFPMDGAKT